jgi:MFS family permease
LPEPDRFTLTALIKKAPVGMCGCIAAGLINSAFFSMAPVFATGIGLSVFELSWFMSITVVGGFAVQWIVGVISDRYDRTLILFLNAVIIALSGIFITIDSSPSFNWLLLEMGFFGGFVFAVYPVSVARTHDVFNSRDAVAVSSALLLCYSIGAIFGPIIASTVMTVLRNPFGLYLYWALVAAVFATITIFLRQREKILVVPVEEQVNFIPMKSTSSVAMVLDPRSDAEAD